MAETPYSKFRLSPDQNHLLDCLAASAGNRSAALREAVIGWHQAVDAAGRQNAADLTPAEWTLLGHTNDPAITADHYSDRASMPDWSRVLAREMVDMYEGRPALTTGGKSDAKAAAKLARKIADWGPIRGYALMSALRYFWRWPEAGITVCTSPDLWLTPTAGDKLDG